MSLGRRIVLCVTGAFCGTVLGAVWYWSAQTEYGVLFAGLTAEDASAITGKLQAQGASYRLTAGGTTILVPVDQVAQRRIELVSDGLPAKGGKGFELFDTSSLGMTSFTQHVNYMRALQAELARTISQIDPVVSARVHIVQPDPSPFLRERKPTTASIWLRLRPGASLQRGTAAAVVAFVSRSVEGLTADNVTLVDANGRLLSEPQGGDGGAVSSQMDYRKDLETYLSSKAEGMLAQALGSGRAVVRVTAEINFQRSHEKKETYNPVARAVTSEMITSSKATGLGSGVRGAAGTTSNSGKGGSAATAVGGTDVQETVKTEFVVSKVTQEFEDKVGAIERLTIAAMIDLSATGGKGDGASTSLTLIDAQEIIKQAVGFKPNRDQIEIKNVKLPPITPLALENERPGPDSWQNIISLVRNGSVGLAALTTLVLGWMVLRRVLPIAKAGAPAVATDNENVQPRLVAALQQDPEAIAKVLNNWLEQSDKQRAAAA